MTQWTVVLDEACVCPSKKKKVCFQSVTKFGSQNMDLQEWQTKGLVMYIKTARYMEKSVCHGERNKVWKNKYKSFVLFCSSMLHACGSDLSVMMITNTITSLSPISQALQWWKVWPHNPLPGLNHCITLILFKLISSIVLITGNLKGKKFEVFEEKF